MKSSIVCLGFRFSLVIATAAALSGCYPGMFMRRARGIYPQQSINVRPAGQVVYGQPVYGQPVYQQPVYAQQYGQQPVYQQPVYAQQYGQQPVYQQPPMREVVSGGPNGVPGTSSGFPMSWNGLPVYSRTTCGDLPGGCYVGR